eukprot:scaffold224268_cov30-Tisochrysis_lutea.AAC.3
MRWLVDRLISVTRSLKVRSSRCPSMTLVTVTVSTPVCRASQGPLEISRLTICPKSTAPVPEPAATWVESPVQAREKMEPHDGCALEYDQPDLSQSRSMLNEPTAKTRPFGAQRMAEMEYSTGAEL